MCDPIYGVRTDTVHSVRELILYYYHINEDTNVKKYVLRKDRLTSITEEDPNLFVR